MALTYSRALFSGGTSGLPIEVVTVASPGTIIHTVGATATTAREEIYLYIANGIATLMPATVEFGSTASSSAIKMSIPGHDGLYFAIPGISLTATTSIVRVYSTGTATDVLRVSGWVNRAT